MLNILLHQDDRLRKTKFRAFAFASPPVYSPLSQVPDALQSAVNYLHDMDDVPFLSGDSIRHQVAALTAVDEHTKDMDLVHRGELILGKAKASAALTQIVTDAFYAPLAKKERMPLLMAPALCIAWACEKGETGKYDMKLCDPTLLAKSAIYMDPKSVTDHYPTRYERAFINLRVAETS